MPEFLIGIPTYNGWKRVSNLLQNLRQRTPASIDHAIVVCDDSGRPDHRSIVRGICQQFGARYIENPVNRGVPASWNALVQSDPGARYSIILNDDILVDKDWLTPVAYALRSNPRAAAFSLNCHFITDSDVPAILTSPEATVVPLWVRYEKGQLIRNERHQALPVPSDGPPGRVMCPAGCAFGFRREIYDMVGGFDERYFAFYEETDFGVTSAWKGFPSFTLPNPPHNYHIWSATFGSAPEKNWGEVMAQSRRKFVEKWSAKLGISFSDAPELHHRIMDKIPPFEVKWLSLNGQERASLL